jgi:exopolysaccharide production protein ExoZ
MTVGDQVGLAMLYSIQYLRAIAASLVALFHTSLHLTSVYSLPAFEKGQVGVDIFFVISGFLMWQTTAKPVPPTPAEFFNLRVTRIAPLYWIVTLLMFVMPAISGTIAGATTADPWHLIASLTFVAYPYPADPSGWCPVYVPGWTINYEIFFYALFALSLFVQGTWARLATILGALLVLVVAGDLLNVTGTLIFYTSPLLLEFAAGMLIGAFYATGRRVPFTVAVGAVLVGLVALYLAPNLSQQREFYWGIPAALILFGAVFLDRLGSVREIKALKIFGDASYSLYLTHIFSIGIIIILWNALGFWKLSFGGVAFVIVAFGASSAAAIMVYLFVEKPLLTMARRRSQPMVSTPGQ